MIILCVRVGVISLQARPIRVHSRILLQYAGLNKIFIFF